MKRIAVTLTTTDGIDLAATRFEPAEPRGSVVVIAGAMGVQARFYDAFATALAGAGHAVLSFDFRGIGASAPRRLRGFRARARDWGERDLAAAIAHMRAQWPQAPLALVGHSFGGQVFGLAAGAEHARALVLVAAQSGHWRHWRGLGRIGLWSLWHLGIPALTPLFGYFPMRLLGAGENLPAGVAQEWARWGRQRRYLFDADLGLPLERYPRITAPLRALSFADDGFAPKAAVAALVAEYAASKQREHLELRAETHGLPRIGHFGYFRRESAPLWTDTFDWLRRQLD